MPAPVVADTFACANRFVLNSAQSAEITYGVRSTDMSATDLLEPLEAAWSGSLLNQQSESVLMTSVAVTPLDGASAQQVLFTSDAGDVGDEAVPDQVALVVTLRTVLGGRSHRGRIYIPGIPGLALDSNGYQWNPTALGAIQTEAESWLSAINAISAETELVVVSRLLETATAVSQVQARSGIATQRRRLTGGVIF